MTSDEKLLLSNLLARLDADSATKQPQFRGIVSDREREALRSLLKEPDAGAPPAPLPPTLIEEPQPTDSSSEQHPVIELNTSALSYDSSPAPHWTLCLDFGTAKSKAFAATDDPEPELLPLPLGKADGDREQSVHELSSSVWIDKDGLLFMGSEAVTRAMHHLGDSTRRPLYSLKQRISQVHPEDGPALLEQKLPKEIDPTLTLTYSDVITFYLAYLTDLATSELERDKRIETRYVRRRFTLPWWTKEQRKWAGDLLTKSLIRAQLLADTFHGKWQHGIHVDQIKPALKDAAAHDGRLAWIVLTEPADGVLEALAAASARVWNDLYARDLMLVVDVGAGTTDISLFWVVQRVFPNRQSARSPEGPVPSRRAWPVEPCGIAIRQAGDQLDSLLVKAILHKANLGADNDLQQRVRDGLLRRSVRLLKETLFNNGEITQDLVTDQAVTLTREEFTNSEGVKRFENQICTEIQKLLDRVDKSWAPAVEDHGITLVLTGGGNSLPMIRGLKDRLWKIGTRTVKCRLAADLPRDVAERFSSEFINEYPRLTVAMGGALEMLLDERKAEVVWHGGTPPLQIQGAAKWV